MNNTKVRICFVCTGNICRSPLAEAVLRDELQRRGISERFEVDSAGTHAHHTGEESDSRMRRVASAHGVNIRHRARQFRDSEAAAFDYVLAMDTGHERALKRQVRGDAAGENITMFRNFDSETDDTDYPDVPDPWYGNLAGFERVFEMVSRTCLEFADHLERAHSD